MLGQQFYADKKFHGFLHSHFVLFRAIRGEPKGDAVFKRFNVLGTPTSMIIGSDGSEVDWHLGYSPPPENFLKKLDKSVKGIDTFQSLSGQYSENPKNVGIVFKLAEKYYEKLDNEKAISCYKEVLALDPDGKFGTTEYRDEKVTYTEYAAYSIGALSLSGKKKNTGLLKKFISEYPDSKLVKPAYTRLGYFYREGGEEEEAVQFFEEFISKYPGDPTVLDMYVSRIIRKKGDLDKGIELAEKVRKLTGYNPVPSFTRNLAELYCLKGDKNRAEEIYGKTFMKDSADMLAYDIIDYANFWTGKKRNLESVEEMLKLAVKLKPESRYVLQSTAGLFFRMKKEEIALEVFGPGYIEKHKDDISILSGYVKFWAARKKNLDSALDAAKHGIELSSTSPRWDDLAWVYFKMERYEDAIKAEKKAIALSQDPNPGYEKKLKQFQKALEKEKGQK